MSFTETTRTSWFARLKNALVGFLIGIVLVIGSIWALVWNEGRSIKTYRALGEGASIVVSVNANEIVPSNEGKLVHVSGKVKAGSVPSDEEFGVAADGALAIRREVEMYQWVESSESTTEKKLGGSEETITTYKYAKEWRQGRENSSDFRQPEGHENPQLIVESENFTVDTATVGVFSVTGENIAYLGAESDLKLTDEEARAAANALSRQVHIDRGGLYVGANVSAPAIGDIRIRYSRADLDKASLVAVQEGGSLKPYTTTNGREIFLTASGNVDATQMFADAEAENSLITWLVRAGGMIGLFIGFSLIFSILGVVADVVPFFGSLVGFGTGLVALVLTVLIGPLVIAIGWFAYRPLLSLGLLAGGALVAFGVIWLRRGKAAAPAFGRRSAT
ncbi:TMEM43 family protein [Rhizobium sp. S153]|uniref:TMEM43 family protein n=1 Tax=Ciceribacter sichuanensis TaxID=2949647 RepID=A0ABT0V7D9_9HYPH|nr:TMEM43 family protein [Ciceribacter sp. S153]MCM2401573.1 TMEM43 family protein [Ciceribacter sp. S153]